MTNLTTPPVQSQVAYKIDQLLAHFGGREPDLTNPVIKAQLTLQDRCLLVRLHFYQRQLQPVQQTISGS